MEKKAWYKTWWGILLVISFWVFLVPVVLFQSKISKKMKIVFGAVYCFFALPILISALLYPSIASEEAAKAQVTSEKTVKKEEKETAKTEEEKKKEIEDKVAKEKARIKQEFVNYEAEHLKLWNKMTESMGKNDVYSSYDDAKKVKENIVEIWRKIGKLKCNVTGDEEFDKKCKELIENGNNTYLIKQDATEKLMAWFEDVNSPKKASEAKESLEQAGKYWRLFQIQLLATTTSAEELEKMAKESEKESKK